MMSVFANESNSNGFDETCASLGKGEGHGEVLLAVSDIGVARVLKDK